MALLLLFWCFVAWFKMLLHIRKQLLHASITSGCSTQLISWKHGQCKRWDQCFMQVADIVRIIASMTCWKSKLEDPRGFELWHLIQLWRRRWKEWKDALQCPGTCTVQWHVEDRGLLNEKSVTSASLWIWTWCHGVGSVKQVDPPKVSLLLPSGYLT